MHVLIIGGNRFFGRRLAMRLLESGHHVTLLNRQNQLDGLGSHQDLERIKCDRSIEADLEAALKGKSFDAVVDQVCYEAKDARAACRVFRGKTPLYVFTSTISVYNGVTGQAFKEDDYLPRGRKFTDVATREDYGEAKRQCETVFFDQGDFRVLAPRFPIVCGTDDPSGRLAFHIDHVKQGKTMQIENIESKMTYISSAEAGAALHFLLESKQEGPVNIGSRNQASIGEVLGWISKSVGKDPIVSTKDGDPSPYAPEKDFYPTVDRLQSWGFNTSRLEDWMPQLIDRVTMQG